MNYRTTNKFVQKEQNSKVVTSATPGVAFIADEETGHKIRYNHSKSESQPTLIDAAFAKNRKK